MTREGNAGFQCHRSNLIESWILNVKKPSDRELEPTEQETARIVLDDVVGIGFQLVSMTCRLGQGCCGY